MAAQTKAQMIMLRNLNCPVCAAKLETAARQLPGMKSARVAFGSGALHVEYDPDQLTEERIRELVRRTGLEVAAVMPGARAR
ncbi:MAG: cation transporter [Bacillota bacterium]|nr:cation transporter [Bacillota bacterium]